MSKTKECMCVDCDVIFDIVDGHDRQLCNMCIYEECEAVNNVTE